MIQGYWRSQSPRSFWLIFDFLNFLAPDTFFLFRFPVHSSLIYTTQGRSICCSVQTYKTQMYFPCWSSEAGCSILICNLTKGFRIQSLYPMEHPIWNIFNWAENWQIHSYSSIFTSHILANLIRLHFNFQQWCFLYVLVFTNVLYIKMPVCRILIHLLRLFIFICGPILHLSGLAWFSFSI